MSAAYDYFDYPSYWIGGEYEHNSEVFALKNLLNKIPKIKKLIDMGSGYGRLTPYYLHRAEKIILVDPSARLLSLARKKFNNKKITYIQAKLENIKNKIKKNNADLIVLIRVIHHLHDLDQALPIVNRLCKKNGYLILEFPNKRHIKAIISDFFKGDVFSMFDIFPKDINKHHKKNSNLPFVNYHPDFIKEKLFQYGFKIIEVRSVSNIRNKTIKKYINTNLLLAIEKLLQKLLSFFYFGPSIFILSKKV